MEERFDGKWVVISNPVTSEKGEFIEGDVVFHSSSKQTCNKELLKVKSKRTAMFYFRKLSEGVIYAL